MTLLDWIRRKKEPTAAAAGDAAHVPGRDQAAEATLHASHLTPNALTLLGLSLLAASLLYWYYARAYAHVHKASPTFAMPNATPPPDSPLPPLPKIEPLSVAPKAGFNPGATTEPHGFVIGNILDPSDDLARETAETHTEGDGLSADPNPPVSVDPSAMPVQRPQARRLDGAVFTRATVVVNPPTPIGIDSDVLSTIGVNPKVDSPSPAAEPGSNTLTTRLHTETTPTIAAAVLPTQRLLLPKGAFLDCTLETAIDSTLPSLTTCLTAFDTFSADGTVVLLERGTKLIGEMRSQVQQGSNRVFVLWTEARTPKGIVVPLASTGTDELGRTGIPGAVDRHFGDRFGAAILVSMIDGAIQGAANRSQKSGGTVVLNPSGAGDITTEVLRSTINIPPTVRVPPGARIQVLVARDLDFRSVYSLHVR